MGAWGVGIFSNDISCDVRDDFRERVAAGGDPVAVTQELIEGFDPDADPDVAFDFWIGLAVTQHRIGRVVELVRDRALEFAVDPGELERWEPGDRRRRAAAIAKAVALLQSPPPSPRRLPKPRTPYPDMPLGQNMFFKLDNGRRVLLRVETITGTTGPDGKVAFHAQLLVLGWSDDQPVPVGDELRNLRPARHPDDAERPHRIWVVRERGEIDQRVTMCEEANDAVYNGNHPILDGDVFRWDDLSAYLSDGTGAEDR